MFYHQNQNCMFFQVPGVGAASKFASLEPPDTAASVSGFGDCGSGSGVGSEVDSAWDHFRNHRFSEIWPSWANHLKQMVQSKIESFLSSIGSIGVKIEKTSLKSHHLKTLMLFCVLIWGSHLHIHSWWWGRRTPDYDFFFRIWPIHYQWPSTLSYFVINCDVVRDPAETFYSRNVAGKRTAWGCGWRNRISFKQVIGEASKQICRYGRQIG